MIRIVEFLAILIRKFLAFGGRVCGAFDLFFEQDVCRALRAQHRDLGRRPGIRDVCAEVLAGHDHVRAAICLARDDTNFRNRGFGIGIKQFGAVTNDPAMFLGDAWQESW